MDNVVARQLVHKKVWIGGQCLFWILFGTGGGQEYLLVYSLDEKRGFLLWMPLDVMIIDWCW